MRILLYKTILLLFLIFSFLSGFAQNSKALTEDGVLNIFGVVQYNGKKLSEVNVTLESDGKELVNIKTNKKGKYSVDLQLHKEYELRFHKEEFESKSVNFKTHVPDTLTLHKFEYELNIDLESIIEEN